MIPPFLATAWASKMGRPLLICGGVILLLGLVFLLGRCTGDDDQTPQVEQGNRSAAAVADAAADAIETLEGRTASENAIDQAVQEAVSNIGAATDAAAVERAVLAAVCGTTEHRNDPACVPNAESRQ